MQPGHPSSCTECISPEGLDETVLVTDTGQGVPLGQLWFVGDSIWALMLS